MPTPSRSPQNTVKTPQQKLDFLRVHNELGKVTNLQTSFFMDKKLLEKSAGTINTTLGLTIYFIEFFKGISPIGIIKLEPSICSERTCKYSNMSLESKWTSSQVIFLEINKTNFLIALPYTTGYQFVICYVKNRCYQDVTAAKLKENLLVMDLI